ncbi:putative lipid II flippase FtsW [Micrococcus terreus]|uniref:putative lipid II flippase FtsW n=1 Tax=Micrococcus terreus TaxID=574650 RepID=UPI0033E608B0
MVTTPHRPSSRTRGPARAGGSSSVAPPPLLRRIWAWIEGSAASSTSYFLVLGCTLALTVIGLVMVLSSSSVENIGTRAGSYDLFIKQGIFACGGIALMFLISRFRPHQLKALAWPALGLAIILLLLVFTPLGKEVGGNRNWIEIGGQTAQPSEAAKLALCLWSAAVLERKARLVGKLQHSLVPVVFPGGAVVVALILLGRDLGTSLVIMLILAVALFLAGTRLTYFAIAGGVAVVGVVILALASGNRNTRILAWLGQNCDAPSDPCYQSDHGMYALASGGWWGVGLGQSRQKWSYIPEAENDFIFTILGEELGLLGALLVLALFAGLAVGMFRVARRADSLFVRICTGTIMAWIIGQAFVNIAMVTGLLPVIGIPLPFISYGGSALTLVLLAMGVVLSFAREERRAILARTGQPPAPTPADPAAKPMGATS